MKLIAKHHGAEITEVRNKYGRHDGHLITVLPGEHGSNQDVALNDHEMTPKCTQIAPKSPLSVNQPCFAENTPCSQESTDRASLVPHRASVGAPLDSSLDVRVDDSRNKELRRTAVAVAPPIDRSKSSKAIEIALRLFDHVQKCLGGPLSDPQTRDVLQQAALEHTEDEAIRRVAVGLQVAHGWAWIKAAPSSRDAGQCLHAALQGKIWEIIPQENCDLMTDEPPTWNGQQWIENISGSDFHGLVRENVLEARRAPSALNKEMPLVSIAVPSEAITGASQRVADAISDGHLVNSSVASPPAKNQSLQVKNGLSDQEAEEERLSRLRAEAHRQAANLPLSGSANRYGIPA
ncbi:hypothetical protein ACLM45_13580 [Synechococcus sp. A10-1-5-9]|uniref:hypothetical protein n=1 Tax=Synechococcus sp. A10-1-5-9 TaxID=3392295 RepID=UPI0039EA4785